MKVQLTKFLPYLLIVVALILGSCGSAAKKIRRANKLIAQAEALGAKWSVDTVYKTVEVPVPLVTTDTVFKSTIGDTIRIEKDRLSIKYVRLPGEAVFIEGKCLPDTIRVKVPVIVNKEINAGKSFWYYLWRGLGILVFGFIGGYLYRALSSKKVNITFNKESPRD